MRTCALSNGDCSGAVQWHHVWKYAGRQINEIWAIVPLCQWHHDHEENFRDIIELISYFRKADFGKFDEYPKFNWMQNLNFRLNQICERCK